MQTASHIGRGKGDYMVEKKHPPERLDKYAIAINLIPHRSWKRAHQVDLLYAYCLNEGRIFTVFPFLKFMRIKLFIKHIMPYLPENSQKQDLRLYRLNSAIKNQNRNLNDAEKQILDTIFFNKYNLKKRGWVRRVFHYLNNNLPKYIGF